MHLFLLSQAVDQDKLHFVLAFVSQGTVTPKYPIPTDNWKDWEEKGPDELTAMGMREQYLLGRELRRQYNIINFIDFNYIIDQVRIRMIDHNYAIMSGQSFLRGFLGDNNAILNASQMTVAKPPFDIADYFTEKIGAKVLPAGIGTLPFYTHYPHNEDVFAPIYCPNAQKVNAQMFITDKDVANHRKTYESSFLELIAQHYEKRMTFPEYVSLLESIQSAIYQEKETSLNLDEENLIKEFSEALYHPYRALSKEANQYRLSGLFNFTATFMNESMNAIVNNVTEKQNIKAAFIFTEDVMIASFLDLYNRAEIVGSATIIRFEVYGPKQPTFNNLNVKILKDDTEIKAYNSFDTFFQEISDFIKANYTQWCTVKN